MAGFNVGDWRGRDVYLEDDEKLGRLEDVYYDADTDEAAFLCVRTGKLTHAQTLVPAREVHVTPDRLIVAYTSEGVDGAPTTKPGAELTVEDEERAYRHYSLDYEASAKGGRRLLRR